VNTALPGAKLVFVRVTVPFAPTAGVILPHAGPDNDTNVVPAGRGSLTLTFAASLGPLFVIVIVYVRFDPAVTGSGESVFVTAMSADVATVVVAFALSLPVLGSLVDDVAVAVFESTVPDAVDGST